MDTKERLFQELETLCKGSELDFEKIGGELSEFIGGDEIIDYYIAQGPLPSFPATIFDIFVLSGKLLYDYEVKQKAVLCHVLFLREITEIVEGFTEGEGGFLSVHFRGSGLGAGLVSETKLSESGNLRRFSRNVRKKLLESM